MQPTATMATGATTTATITLTTTWDNTTDRPTRYRGGREDHHHLPGQRHPPGPRLGAARFRLISVSLKPTRRPRIEGGGPGGPGRRDRALPVHQLHWPQSVLQRGSPV
ncbi:CACN subunit beta associated regulatory protein [Rhinolophus ferrumequinum]|uniref:CACN subunit beta associated regulatory protein n=1 Tax=Rhinolophus ferrumequinum TaxID=59479 RepID=A0A7J7TZ77_RHIFE|nr:CACN subunit beta associated regulatory protein [Rhinolophus ferrumequinum]